VKIFVSYSRRDAGDFANQINRHLSSFNYDIFTDVDDIRAGDIWSNIITSNISNCDIFVVIVTRGALRSPHVEREVLQAQKENKKIIPCFFRNINPNKIRWELDKIQGVEFSDKYELARELDSKINIESNIPIDKDTENIIGSISKSVKDVKTDKMTPAQKKEDLQPIPKRRIGALGSGVLYVPSKTAEDDKTTKSEVNKLKQKKERPELPPKVSKDDKVQSESSGDIAALTNKKEEKEKRKYTESDSNKPRQGIFTASKTVEETKTNAPTTSFKSDTKEIPQKKDTLSHSNTNIEPIGGSGGVPSAPKYNAPESDNNERKYTERESSRRSQSVNLKLIIIPIIVVAIIGAVVSVSYFYATSYQHIKAWGSEGTGDGQFHWPYGIAVDSSTGNVYVADSLNYRIQKFDSNGNFITKWGSEGTGDGQFNHPNSISIDSSTGNVYVADTWNDRIQKFDSNGNFITKWGSEGTGDGQFNAPYISVDSSRGNVYVLDATNHRIQKFDTSGNFITKWGSEGTGDGQFKDPEDIAVDSSTGNVYVLDTINHLIQKFDSDGNFLTKWGSYGMVEAKQFDRPNGITVDSLGNLYVVDNGNGNIKKFDSNGNIITKWRSGGTEIAVNSSTGNVYVVETTNNNIQVFAPTK
jgi:sugar lactone lactonase YvrE